MDDPLLLLGVVLVAGVASGMLARRVHLPSVTGQILVGILLGQAPHLLHVRLFGPDAIHALQPVTHFALGLMAVAVGSHLHWRKLRPAKRRLLLLLLAEVVVVVGLVYVGVTALFDVSRPFGLLVAVISLSTAPATILAIVKETRSRGVFVRTLVAAVALNNIAAIVLFEVAHTASLFALDPALGHGLADVLLRPLGKLVFSLLLGGGVGALLVLVTRKVVRPDRLTTMSLLAILLTAGVAAQYHDAFSTLLACLFLGVTLANLTPEKEEIGHEVFVNFEHAIFAIFFTVAGMELDFGYLALGGGIALVVFALRLVGKNVAARLAMRLAGATDRVRRHLGLALVPQAGLAVGLMLLVTEDQAFASIASLFLAVVLTLVTLNEIVGPLMTRWALVRSGDFGKDRARLIDFLHEENITTDLRAPTLTEAIDQLVGLLVRSHGLDLDRDELRRAVLERESEASTLLGDGLAIPHGEIEVGEGILGVMGISREGLDFPTPDGRPVHCVVLLATPPSQRTRHLEVLAAFARAIGADRAVRDQLYHARTPAHAYEILHAEEEAEDFNVFLEE